MELPVYLLFHLFKRNPVDQLIFPDCRNLYFFHAVGLFIYSFLVVLFSVKQAPVAPNVFLLSPDESPIDKRCELRSFFPGVGGNGLQIDLYQELNHVLKVLKVLYVTAGFAGYSVYQLYVGKDEELL